MNDPMTTSPSPEQRTAKNYERDKLWLHLAEMALVVAVLAVFYVSGGSRALAAFARSTGGCVWGTVAVYVAVLLAGGAALTFPLSFWSGFRLEHRFNLSKQTFGAWLWDEMKAFALSLVFLLVAAEVVYALLRAADGWWWLCAAAFMAAFELAMRKLAGQNMADMEPHPVVEFLFHDHPALSKRIAKAAAWRQAQDK